MAPEDVERVVELLEIREKQYDLRVQLDLYADDADADDADGAVVEDGGGVGSAGAAQNEKQTGNGLGLGRGEREEWEGDVKRQGEQPAVRGALTYIATEDPTNLNWLGPASVAGQPPQVSSSRHVYFRSNSEGQI